MRDIRERFADNRYRITYDGDPARMIEAAERIGAGASVCESDRLGNRSMLFTLGPSATKRDLIEALNRTADICSFEQVIPSMDDIFVSAVKASETGARQSAPAVETETV